MKQKNDSKMHPGAFHSCLVPFTDQILDWWYDDHLTAAEIQRRLAAQGLTVVHSTVTRFIKVRERRAKTRIRPEALKKKTTTPTPSAKSTAPIPSQPPPQSRSNSPAPDKKTPPQRKALTPEEAEGEAMLKMLRESTPQELGRLAEAAKLKRNKR